MKLFRYRKPSWKTVTGLTKAKKRFYKAIGWTRLMAPFRFWTNLKRRIKRRLGYESDAGRLLRNGLPRPGGCLVLLLISGMLQTVLTVAIALCFLYLNQELR
jgi:hypothetical protein